MNNFNYHRPASVADARALFSRADDPVYIAGGHTLLPAMKQRLREPSDVIDLAGISELTSISVSDDEVTIGALACHANVAESADVANTIPALADLASGIGDAQVRNRGTIGGSVANSDPAADYPAAVLGLGATVVTNQREIAGDDFFTDMFETALEEGEVITAIRFPIPKAAAYAKFPSPASRYATVGVMVSQGSDTRVAITGAGPCVFRSTDMEQALSSSFSADAISGITIDASDLNADMHASAEYRAHLCVVMAGIAVERIAS